MHKQLISLCLILVLICSFILSFAGCGGAGEDAAAVGAVDLMTGFVPKVNSGSQTPISETTAVTAADFAAKLLKEAYDGKNVLLSPLSILSALAMTANGAKGETLSEMLNAFGVSSIDELNEFFSAYLDRLPNEKNCKLSLANSIWFRDAEDLVVKDPFLQTNADCFRAGAYRAPFDGETVKEINRWVNDHTDGMIDKILDRITPLSMLYLVNALAFDAKWAMPYKEKEQILKNASFRKEDGTYATVTYLQDNEYRYLVDGDLAVGFSKPYADQRFAFVALRPNDGVTVEDYIATLSGEKIVSLLRNAQKTSVETRLPKFETRYSIELSAVLSAMGMPLAFTDDADFTGITDSVPLKIGNVRHKTFISVGEAGTRAAAVTLVEMKAAAASSEYQPPKVYLDRSFVYMLVDTETNFPFFIGTLNNPN